MIKKTVYHALLVVFFCMARVSTILMIMADFAYFDAKKELEEKRRNKEFAKKFK